MIRDGFSFLHPHCSEKNRGPRVTSQAPPSTCSRDGLTVDCPTVFGPELLNLCTFERKYRGPSLIQITLRSCVASS